jgi:glycosyltransferase involved in cell wall biosynthesis
MSFRLSPVALLSGSIPTALYWNDHPTHFATPPQTFAPVKRVIRAALRSLVWCGARNTSLVMPISEFHVKDLLANGCDADRICVIQMGVDRSFSGVALNSAPRNCNGPLELLYIGTVSKIRGRDVMLDAMARVNARSTIACLTFVGVLPDQVEYCIARGRELGISEAVRVVGRIPGHEIPQLMKNADAGICIMEDQTWYRFNPPTKLFEYLVAGLPVLASDIRTHTKYIRHWDNGLIFDYGDSALAQAIDELWLRRAELPALKQRAWESGKQYLWDEIEGVFLESVSNMEHE